MGFTVLIIVSCSIFIHVSLKSAYWHFNTALLNLQAFRNAFKLFWFSHRESRSAFSSIQQWWDIGKTQIKQLCQQFTRKVNRDLTQTMKDLERQVEELQSLVASTGNRGHLDSLKSTQMERVLDHWRRRLADQDILLLNSFKDGSISPNVEDPFPATFLALDVKGFSGPLVQPAHPVSLEAASGKTLYRTMAKTLNIKNWMDGLTLLGGAIWVEPKKPDLIGGCFINLHWVRDTETSSGGCSTASWRWTPLSR